MDYEDTYAEEDGLDGGAEEGGSSSWLWIIIAVVVVAVIIVVIILCCRKKKTKNDKTFGVPTKGGLKDADSVKFYESFETQFTKIRANIAEELKKVKADPKATAGSLTKDEKAAVCKDLQAQIDAAKELLKAATTVNERVPIGFSPRANFVLLLAKGEEEIKLFNSITGCCGHDHKHDDKDHKHEEHNPVGFNQKLTESEAAVTKIDGEVKALVGTLNTEVATAKAALPAKDDKKKDDKKKDDDKKDDKDAKKQD
jgi:hypothetical protein